MGDILFLAHRVPFPPDRGDKIRGHHVLKFLAARARVHLVAFADDPRDMDCGKRPTGLASDPTIVRREKARLTALGEALIQRQPMSLTAFDHREMRAAVDRVLTRETIDTIYVFSGQMAQYLPPRAGGRVIMDFVDMDSAKFADYAAESNGLMAWLMRREARLLQAFERQIAGQVDAALLVSATEAALFRQHTGAANVHVVENGIDADLYDPVGVMPVAGVGPLIVFTGQMDYRPNVAGVTWFADAILPQVRARFAAARFAIVGRNPGAAVRALGTRPGIEVTGEVADVRGWLAAAACVVAPLKVARGVQNKVLEAMAMARPVVASRAAAEGIDHDGTILVGADAAGLADAVNRVLADPAGSAGMGAAARRQVVARYGWNARLAPLDALLGHGVACPARSAA
ncbi:TIGR03087 family PEP-CTERM/XrtA system glycosyltransferase [uncultured Sphingomonas sp.]|uniref:TIGR03087 family PEP-CTERM/XrtA system glycosyltransferase n=1 Tax=uncultured Sphingomonas sp. TaxID=158754 RepID=UPI0035C95638